MADTFVFTTLDDPRAAPLLHALNRHYENLYGWQFGEEASWEILRYPPTVFLPPDGAFVLLQRDGETIGGGGFMRYDDETAEIKRVWTSDAHRRQGLARKLLTALEDHARQAGYRRIYLTTGYQQAAATELYLNAGYTALFDRTEDLSRLVQLPFEKAIA